MPQWRSPLHSPTCHIQQKPSSAVATPSPLSVDDRPTNLLATADDDETASDNGVVVVPSTGLYGICFGHPDGPFETSVSDVPTTNDGTSTCEEDGAKSNITDDAASRQGRGKKRKLSQTRANQAPFYCGCTCRAEFQIETSGGKTKPVCISLPLPAEKRDVLSIDDRCARHSPAAESSSLDADCREGERVPGHSSGESSVLTSTMIGRIAHLPANTRVRVYVTHTSPSCRPVTGCCDGDHGFELSNDPSSDLTSPITRCPLKWCLVFHRESAAERRSEDGEEEEPSNSTTAALRERIDFNPGDVRGKIFLCSECGRRFPATASVRNHVLAVHVAKEGGSSSGGGGISAPAVVGPPILRRPLEVAYSDDVLAVVIKPQGISVMGERWTLSRSDLFLPLKASPDTDRPLTKPRIVHRLDSPTGGLLVLAKTVPAEIELKKCFANRACQKRYRAILFGKLVPGPEKSAEQASGANDCEPASSCCPVEKFSGTCDLPIDGKPSVTRYNVVSHTRCSDPRANGWISTVDLFPTTGRSHQLRKHMKALGHAIWGDRTYGPYDRAGDEEVMLSATDDCAGLLMRAIPSKNPHIKLCLWALEITLPPVCSGKEATTVCIDEPTWYKELRDSQEESWIQLNKEQAE